MTDPPWRPQAAPGEALAGRRTSWPPGVRRLPVLQHGPEGQDKPKVQQTLDPNDVNDHLGCIEWVWAIVLHTFAVQVGAPYIASN